MLPSNAQDKPLLPALLEGNQVRLTTEHCDKNKANLAARAR